VGVPSRSTQKRVSFPDQMRLRRPISARWGSVSLRNPHPRSPSFCFRCHEQASIF
jgi:hypothetical protein